jgi:hypothetical protein
MDRDRFFRHEKACRSDRRGHVRHFCERLNVVDCTSLNIPTRLFGADFDSVEANIALVIK